MRLLLIRRTFGNTFTAGELYYYNEQVADGELIKICDTIEPTRRELSITTITAIDGTQRTYIAGKVNGKTAIPEGEYELIIYPSQKFGQVPKLQNVPAFSGILIHAGNTAQDTKGCILVGTLTSRNVLSSSRQALTKVITTIKKQNIKQIEVR